MKRKERLTVTVDRDLIDAGNEALAAGRVDSLSGWVNTALAEYAAREKRRRALATAVAAYEAQFGEISAQEIAVQHRADQEAAIVLRGSAPRPRPRRPRRAV